MPYTPRYLLAQDFCPICCPHFESDFYYYTPPNEVGGGGYTGFTLSICPSICRWHGFRSVTQVCLEISISNFTFLFIVVIVKSLLIFSDVTFKMAAWQPYWFFFCFRTPTLVYLWISSPNFTGTWLVCLERSLLIFSNVTFKMAVWRPYWIFQYLDYIGGMVSRLLLEFALEFQL